MTKLRFSRKQLCIPYAVFLILFVIAPLFVIVYYAFTNGEGRFSFGNFADFFTSTNTLGTLFYSFGLAIVTTSVCLLIAYPTAYVLARSDLKKKYVLLMLFILPMWINFTLRITLLPLYTSLQKMDKSLLEAASDLGANRLTVFLRVTLPLSVPGIISGVTMVLLPSMTNYVVLDMLYNSTYIMGSLIGSYFSAYDWHNGSMISLVLLVIIFIVTLVTNRFSDKDANTSRGTVL